MRWTMGRPMGGAANVKVDTALGTGSAPGGARPTRRSGWRAGWRGAWALPFGALAVAVSLAVAPAPGAAQVRPDDLPLDRLDLPRSVANRIVAFFNDTSTIRFYGGREISSERVVEGNLGVLGGTLEVAGRIEGDVMVVDGDLVVTEQGHITGDVTVVGGRISAGPDAVGGQITVYDETLPYRDDRGGVRRAGGDNQPWGTPRRYGDRSRGRSTFTFTTTGNYNRVEGLPVALGPRFRSSGNDYLDVEALGIWRSERGFESAPDDWGYQVRMEQHLGPEGRFSLGGTAHSLVSPIESGGLSDEEASLATFLLHTDYRDYYEREGFSAFLRFDDRDAGVRLTAEYRDEDHAFAPHQSPWALRDRDDPWRPQPLVAEGRLRTLGGELVVDDRNDRDDPTDGWYLIASATHGLSGSLSVPAYWTDAFTPDAPYPTPTVATRAVDTDFTAGSLDLRRYARLGPTTDIRLRGFIGGSADGNPLPPQYQRTLGGAGTLPGYSLMSVACGARTTEYRVARGDPESGNWPWAAYPAYGCDRVALFQAEYRGHLSFDIDLGDDDDWNAGWDWYPNASFTPAWSVFFDAGRGWTLSDPGDPGYLGEGTETLMDVGVGFYLGELGFYWAWPLKGDDRDARFFVRLDHRF